jgi:hypothetical protein
MVASRLAQGLSIAEIAADIGVVKSTVCYHARKLGVPGDSRFARRYNWSEIQRYYDEGHSIRECAKHFGFAVDSWHRAVRCGLLTSRPAAAPLSMALHHVNGDRDDNRLENLALVCPNCHSQTPNFSGRNLRLRRLEAALRAVGAEPLGPTWQLPLIGDAA